MAYSSIIGTANDLGKELFTKLGRFRKYLFVDKFGWELRVQNGEEIDDFDTQNTVYATILSGLEVVAMFRVTRTDIPYLSSVVFRNLATTAAFPRRDDVWEVSRFGAATSEASALNHSLMLLFAHRIGAKSLVAVTDLVYERTLRRFGIRTRRYGPPAVIGRDRNGLELIGVAGEIPITLQAGARYQHILTLAESMEIRDVSGILRRQLVSA